MKHRFITLLSLIVAASPVIAQNIAPIENDKGKWGYGDEQGNIVIKYQYDEASAFADGRALVVKGGKKGYISPDGNAIIAIKYSDITPIGDKYRVALGGKKDGSLDGAKWGIIDHNGNIILKIEYDEILNFNAGLAKITKSGKSGYVDTNYSVIIPAEFAAVSEVSPQGFIWVNKGGSPDKKSSSVIKGGKWGIYNSAGLIIVEPKYNAVGYFVNAPKQFDTFKWLDTETPIQRWIIEADEAPAIFATPLPQTFSAELPDGILAFAPCQQIKDDNCYRNGVVTTDGNIIVEPNKYDAVGLPSDDMAPVAVKNGFSYINLANPSVKYNTTFDIVGHFHNGYAIVCPDKSDKRWYFVDKNMQPGNEKYRYVHAVGDNYIVCNTDNKWGIISGDGTTYITPAEYSIIFPESGGYMAYRKDDRAGYLTTDGKPVEATFDDTRSIHNGIAMVRNLAFWGCLDSKLDTILRIKYRRIIPTERPDFNAIWAKTDKWEAYAPDGKKLFATDYTYVTNFIRRGVAAVARANDAWAIIDLEGNELVPCQWKDQDTAWYAYIYRRYRNISRWRSIDTYRFELMLNEKTNRQPLKSVISESLWDY